MESLEVTGNDGICVFRAVLLVELFFDLLLHRSASFANELQTNCKLIKLDSRLPPEA